MESPETVVAVSSSSRRADEWSTVLAASGIDHRLFQTPGGWAIAVAGAAAGQAAAALAAYEEENREAPVPAAPAPAAPPSGAEFVASLAVALILLEFFVFTGPRRPDVTWFDRGSASAAAIRAGEVWRTVTALTLHADIPHALGNGVACAVLLPWVFQAFGVGTGLWALLIAGAAGNALTAVVHSPPFSSVGASTMTFAAIGVLAAQQIASRHRGQASRRRPWVVVAASVVLLVMLGTGQNADVLGHLFGLLAGAVVGALALVVPRPRPRLDWTLAAAAVTAVVATWWVALRG